MSTAVSVGQTPDSTILRPGESLEFVVSFQMNTDYNSPAVDVDLPSGWSIVSQSSNPEGTYRDSENQWVWLSSGEKTVVYEVKVPTGSTSGEFSIQCEGSVKQPDGTLRTDTTLSTVAVRESITLEEQWRFETEGRIQYSRPIVEDGRVIIGGLSENVYSIDRSTGSEEWVFQRSGSLADSTASVVDSSIYIGSGGGELYSISADTGQMEWVLSGDSARVSSPRVNQETIYIGNNRGDIHAIDNSSSEISWSSSVNEPIYSKPVAGNSLVFVTSNAGKLFALDSETGAVNWSVSVGQSLDHVSPVLYNGTLYLIGDAVYAIEASSGAVEWQADVPVFNGVGGTISNEQFVIPTASMLKSFDTSDGSLLWSAGYGTRLTSQPTEVGNILCVGTKGGDMILVESESGNKIARIAVGGPILSPISSGGGELFVGSDDGSVYSFVTDA